MVAKEKARDEKLAKRGAKPDELAKLTKLIVSHEIVRMCEAHAIIKKQELKASVPAIMDAIRWANTLNDRSIQDELELLGALKAKEALHELLNSKMKIVRGYENWFVSLLKKAGCAIRTVEKGRTTTSSTASGTR